MIEKGFRLRPFVYAQDPVTIDRCQFLQKTYSNCRVGLGGGLLKTYVPELFRGLGRFVLQREVGALNNAIVLEHP